MQALTCYMFLFRIRLRKKPTVHEICYAQNTPKHRERCHKRHNKNMWPSATPSPVLLIGNALCRYMQKPKNFTVHSEKKMTISRLYSLLRFNLLCLHAFKIVVLQVSCHRNGRIGKGKNLKEQQQRQIHATVQKFTKTIRLFRQKYPTVHLVLASVIYWPMYGHDYFPFVQGVNYGIRRYYKEKKLEFLNTFRAFDKKKNKG